MPIKIMPHRAWREVDLCAVRHNFFLLRALAPASRICPVLKANAYGHGAAALAPLYEKWGADALSFATVEEALEARKSGVSLPLCLLGSAPPDALPALASAGITPVVHSPESARALSCAASRAGLTLPVQIKIDTGMGRIGFLARAGREEACARAALAAARLPGLRAVGLFTHFARADECDVGLDCAREQLSRFLVVRRLLFGAGFSLRAHAANSAATLSLPASHLDMIRPGLALYGIDPRDTPDGIPIPRAAASLAAARRGILIGTPTPIAPAPSPLSSAAARRGILMGTPTPIAPAPSAASLAARLQLIPAMRLFARVTQVKWLKKGDAVGYGGDFVAPRRMRVATLAIGYADGICRRHAACGGGVLSCPPPRCEGRGRSGTPAPAREEDRCAARPTDPASQDAPFLPFVGRISMDQSTVDATAAPWLRAGDAVFVLGGEGRVSPREASFRIGSIPYELLTALSPRLPIIYINGD